MTSTYSQNQRVSVIKFLQKNEPSYSTANSSVVNKDIKDIYPSMTATNSVAWPTFALVHFSSQMS